MQLLSAEQMRSLDRHVIDDLGIPGPVLMARAGMAVAEVALARLYRQAGLTVVLCGKGNNGGDGLVVARLLHEEGFPVLAVLPFPADSLSPDAALMYKRAAEIDVPFSETVSDEDLAGASLVIDALLGTGITGPVGGVMGEFIERTNRLRGGRGVLAVDLPSGVDADSGQVHGPAMRAEETITLAMPKPGLVLYPGAAQAGAWRVADIGFPAEVTEYWPCVAELPVSGDVASWLPRRSPTAYKRGVGYALIIAGSYGMTGAAAMATTAAYRAGAGLVRLALPASQVPALNATLTEVVFRPLPETSQGTLGFRSVALLCREAREVHATLIGPGLSRHGATQHAIRRLVAELPGPLVVDADALTAVAGHDAILQQRSAPTLLTPHPGEMARLLGTTTAEVERDRIATAKAAAARFNAVVIFKGTPAIIAAPDGTAYVNPTGTPALAVAGTGDTLAGMTVALLAQGVEPVHAAVLACYVGGLAAEMLTRDMGPLGATAVDLAAMVPYALRAVGAGEP